MINLGSISNKLAFLVLLAVLPALFILFYTGMEQRRHSIESAERDVLLLTRTMAESQEEITRFTRLILSTLSLMPAIQDLDLQASGDVFRSVLEQNPVYNNITLTALDGKVLAAGRTFTGANLADRKHFREALEKKDFVVGEYIVSRVGSFVPAFAFAYPVLDDKGRPKAVLTMAIKLADFSDLHDVANLPEKSFVAVTDHKGIRLFYYPHREETNPVGEPIQSDAWETARQTRGKGIFIGVGSDGARRIFAFEPVRLTPEDPPYLYVWAGIPEARILAPANAVLVRNLLLMLMATVMALFISWLIGKNTLISPIQSLLVLARKFAQGDLEARSELSGKSDEFLTLTKAFHDMAVALGASRRILVENEARFRLLMDSQDAIVYVADMDTYEVLFINEHGRKMFGDVTGKICWQSLQLGQSGPCSFCTNKYLLNGEGKPGGMYAWEFQNTISGQWFYIQDRAIKWSDGRIVRLEIATDISEKKRAEAELSAEKERLAVTLRSIGDGVITTDVSGKIVLLNKVAEKLTGWSSEEVSGRPLAEVFRIVNEKTREICENPVTKVISSGQIVGLANHTVLIAKDGKELSIADSGAPILDALGNIVGVVLVFRDVTEQINTEKELLKTRKLESIGVLAGGIAHDFNNILAAILGNLNLALFDGDLKDNTRKLLSQAEKASLRAKDLTLQLLTFAKGGEPVTEISSLENVIKDSANFVLHGEKVACRYDIPEDLWLVNIDRGQISQVVQNIVLNASHAMPKGGIVQVACKNIDPLHIKGIDLPRNKKFVEVAITDNGIGIPANVVDRIFDPYFSTKQKGSGLGLAISHSIIRKHNGYITVKSTPDAGTTFSLYIPASADQQDKKTGEECIKEVKDTRKVRIMVMDDEQIVRDVVKSMLSVMGHEVLLVRDGAEAIKIYKEYRESGEPIELIIMDLTIPGGMGGQDAVKEVLAIDPGAKVIVSSGYSNDPVMANYQEHGFCAAIVKPYQLQELTRVIHQVMAARQ